VPRRIDAAPALAALGALLLLVALFLDWFGGASGWAVFEVVDLLLAGVAIAALVAVAERGLDQRWLPVLGALALVVVAVQLFEPPPGAATDDRDTGAWLALAGAVLLALGGLLHTAAVSISVQVRPSAAPARRRRVPAVDRRADEPVVARRPAEGDDGHDGVPGEEPPTRIPAVDRRPDAGAGSSSLFAPVSDDVGTTQPLPTEERPVEERR
jgi:hypothetical protein